MTTRNLTCAELDERLGRYLEGTLDDSAVADLELHLSGCAACRALVRDFEQLTRDASALPSLAPSRDLWPEIAGRIEAPVVSLSARASTAGANAASAERGNATTRGTLWRRVQLGAVAAGLVAITAGVTYTLTRNASPAAVAARPALPDIAPVADSSRAVPVPPSAASAPSSDAGAQLASGVDAPAGSVAESPTGAAKAGGAAAVGADVRAVAGTRSPVRATYDSEISQLRGVLAERNEELDPRTVAILRSSIATIDSAITEARAALLRDPSSRFLVDQLNKSLEKKLGLLRTAALLPART